jgi:superfamily I DNA and/or RNA helicase
MKQLEVIESMPKPQSEVEETERKRLRDEAIKTLDLAKAKRTEAAESAKPLEDEIEQWRKRVGKGYGAYKQQNTPVPLDKLLETLKRQQEALDKVHADRKKAIEDLDLATYDEDWEGDDLRHAVAWNAEQLENPPNRHRDWIRKLRELTDAANSKAQDAARKDKLAGTAELLPNDWAARVTPKNQGAKK